MAQDKNMLVRSRWIRNNSNVNELTDEQRNINPFSALKTGASILNFPSTCFNMHLNLAIINAYPFALLH